MIAYVTPGAVLSRAIANGTVGSPKANWSRGEKEQGNRGPLLERDLGEELVSEYSGGRAMTCGPGHASLEALKEIKK